MTFSASAPSKILLFGEWAVLDGAAGVAMATSPRLTTRWKASSHPSDESVVLVRGDGQMALWDPRRATNEQAHVPNFLKKTVGMLSSLMMRAPEARLEIAKGGELRIERSWPLEFGLGSSSAIMACLLETFTPQQERIVKWQMGRDVLRDVQGGRASALDLAAQLRGQFVAVADHKPKPLLNIELPQEICFVHAGNKADTSKLIQEKPLSKEQIQRLALSSENFMTEKNWLLALQEHAAILEETTLWPLELREARTAWKSESLLVEMKSCGAGGGDTWMMWCDVKKQASLKEACDKRNWTFVKYTPEEKGVFASEV